MTIEYCGQIREVNYHLGSIDFPEFVEFTLVGYDEHPMVQTSDLLKQKLEEIEKLKFQNYLYLMFDSKKDYMEMHPSLIQIKTLEECIQEKKILNNLIYGMHGVKKT